MNVSLNRIILVGRLGADAAGHETRIKGGDGFLTFSIAVDNVTKKNGETIKLTDWFRCMIWGRERLRPYPTKGRMVLVEGSDFVLMRKTVYLDWAGVGTEEEMQESLQAIDEGLADIEAGRVHDYKDVIKGLSRNDDVHR